MKEYTAPEMEIVLFSAEDIIFKSPSPSTDGNDNDVSFGG